MRKSVRKSFDCVENVREIRDRIGAEIAGITTRSCVSGSAPTATPAPSFNDWRIAATGIQ